MPKNFIEYRNNPRQGGDLIHRQLAKYMIYVYMLDTCLNAFQDILQNKLSDMFQYIEGVEVVVDDLLIWDESDKQYSIQVLERA